MVGLQGNIIGWIGVIVNLICLFAVENSRFASNGIAASFVFNLIGCFIWLAGLGLGMNFMVLVSIIWWTIPLVIWAFWISFTVHDIFEEHSSHESFHEFFYIGIFIFVYHSIYDFIALKYYRELKNAILVNECTPRMNIVYAPTTTPNCAIIP
ncbi:uncharacterized protein LOC116347245 [Contarinia nasturtii]|uniref:uncharacterized protein LOC116347245 n=1 Tax=Contarinia nasturtii TaxID=265458 RepID=UPI0012D3E358|nr:uncharacterized protein LOC116347245 [Contarinia nasturtii]